VDFTGKRVGLVGTGSTGIQAAPEIAKQAAHLTVFQRTPNFTIPAHDAPLEAHRVRQVKENYPAVREASRWSSGGMPMTPSETPALQATEEERQHVYEAAWQAGGFHFLYGSFGDILRDKAANDTAAEFIRGKIRSIVDDPETAEKLSPRNHPYGAKRPPIDTGYYATFNRDNVTLLDVRETQIAGITPHGIALADGSEHPLDAIVFATGFDAMTGTLLNIDIRGKNGLPLKEKWGDGIPRNYLGLQVSGFPNLFTITGPGSPSVLSNMVTSIEQHVDWVADCIEDMRARGRERIEATANAEQAWVEHTQTVARAALFPLGNSWYMGDNIPGKRRIFTPYAGGVGPYRQICDNVAEKDYEGFAFAT
jgi:cation diffusion facilitator CzcD-associated flavoprotein CzcO